MTQILHVRLLGEFSLTHNDERLTTVNTSHLQSLLAYLVLHRAAPQSRQRLAFLLWPDSSESQAHTNLRKEIHLLRQALPEADDFLCVDSATIQWRLDAPLTLDVADFEQAVARGALDDAVALYAGDLMPSCYADWIVAERERLQRMYVEALEQLMGQRENDRDYHTAIRYARRLLQHDPVREETHRHLIRLHALNGDRAAALRAYHTCATVLQRELGVEPSYATREIYERLFYAGAPPPATPPPATMWPLVGRAAEWSRLLAVWQDAVTGKPQVVLVTGEAGIGKTRLTDELVQWAARQGIFTATGYCYLAEGIAAYAPLVTWLRARRLTGLERIWLTEVARLLPELLIQQPDLPSPSLLTEAWQRQRLHEALARAVLGKAKETAAVVTPLLLRMEDLQWCDRDTLEWLHYLLRFDAQARLLIVGTLRIEAVTDRHPLASLLSALQRSGQLTEIELAPLGESETARLAAHVAGRELDSDATGRLYRETEGNPLFVIEMVRARHVKEFGSRPIDADGAALPLTVQSVLGARFAQLSSPARELMDLAATIGRAFTYNVLKQASDDDDESLVRGLDELWHRRIVREHGAGAYDFSHGKLREVAYACLSAARRRLLHRRVAEALQVVHVQDLDQVSGQVAAHYDRAGLAEQALPYYRRAAQAARRVYANQDAIAFLSRALELTPPTAHAERYELLLAREAIYDVQGMRESQLQDLADLQTLALALQDEQKQANTFLWQGRYAESVSDFGAAIEAARSAIRLSQATQDAQREAAGYLLWGRALWQHGDCESARARLEQALKLAQAAQASDVEADALYNLSCVATYQGDQMRAFDLAAQALRLYRQLDDRRGEFRALNLLGVASNSLGNYAGARPYYEQSWHVCREIGDRRGEALVLRNLGGLSDSLGDYATAQAHYEQSLQICRAISERRSESETLAYLGLLYYHLGNGPVARDYSQRAARLAEQVSARQEQSTALTHLGHAWTSLGQLAQAAEAYGQAVAIRREMGSLSLVMEPLAGLAAVSLAQGDLGLALSHVEEILNLLADHTLDNADEPFWIYLTCVRVLRAGGDPRATQMLNTAYVELQEQAAKILDQAVRRSFLENVAVHRKIVEEWTRQQAAPPRRSARPSATSS